jgi:transforming growth factor-beta-induced protein
MSIRNLMFGMAAVSLGLGGSLAPAEEAQPKDLVATAVAAGSFETLVAAVQAAGLVDTLRGPGPFTVFAPTDEAFAKLPNGTVETLLKPENKARLIAVLTYHVVPGKVLAADVIKVTGATTVNGQRIDVKADPEGVRIDQAQVVSADVACSNGVIHVIDQVLLPATEDIPASAAKAGKFQTLLAAAKAAGLVETLAGEGPLTVFAPTDEAFSKLPAGTVENLLKPENKQQLAQVLKYHVVAGRVYSTDLLAAGEAKSLQGGSLKANVSGGTARIQGTTLVATDIDAANGVIHVIDAVLLPAVPPAKGASVR